MKATSFLIADNHDIVRAGLRFILSQHFNATFFEVSNGNKLFEAVKAHDYDVVFMELNMPHTDAYGILQSILNIRPRLNVLIFSVYSQEIYGKFYMKAGAMGFLQKTESELEIIKAVNCVLMGNVYLPKEHQRLYLGREAGEPKNPFSALSRKEMQVLPFLSNELSVINIAKTMNLSPSTIGTHKANIFKKLTIQNVFELKTMTDLYLVAQAIK